MNYSVVITSAGSGTRANLGYNKLLYKINDRILLAYTVDKFKDAEEIIITASKDDLAFLKDYFKENKKIKVVEGSTNREKSVYCGIKECSNDVILIHDGARVNVSERLINDIYQGVIELSSNVIPVIKDSFDHHSRTIGDLVVQTPQGFKKDVLLEAFKKCDEEDNFLSYRDDSSLVYDYQKTPVSFVLGDEDNFKVTTSEDISRIEKILK